MDEIELQNTIINLRDNISDMEREINDLQDRLDISSRKESYYDGILIFLKDRRDHYQAMGDTRALEVCQEILNLKNI